MKNLNKANLMTQIEAAHIVSSQLFPTSTLGEVERTWKMMAQFPTTTPFMLIGSEEYAAVLMHAGFTDVSVVVQGSTEPTQLSTDYGFKILTTSKFETKNKAMDKASEILVFLPTQTPISSGFERACVRLQAACAA